MKKIILLILISCQIMATNATDYYVNKSGSNGNNGLSVGNAWLTIAHAQSQVNAIGSGTHTIHIGAGTFLETGTINVNVGISWEGVDSAQTIFQSTVNTDFTPSIFLESAQGIFGNQTFSKIGFDGRNLATYFGIVIDGRSNVDVFNCHFYDYRANAITYSGLGTTPNAQGFFGWTFADNGELDGGSTGRSEPSIYAVGNRVANCLIENSSNQDNVYGKGCLQFGGQDGFIVENCTINQPMRGANMTTVGWPIKMSNSGYVRNTTIRNCTLYRAPFVGVNQQGNWNFVLEFWRVRGFNMYNNLVSGMADFLYVSKSDTSVYGLHVFNNTFFRTTLNNSQYEGGIQLETDEADVMIERNTFNNIAQPLVYSPHDYGSGVGNQVRRNTIRYNLFSNIGAIGNQTSAFSFQNAEVNPTTTVDSFFFYNNTVTSSTTGVNMYTGISGINYTGSNSNIHILNNIFVGFDDTMLDFGGDGYNSTRSTITNLKVKNNIFWDNGSGDGSPGQNQPNNIWLRNPYGSNPNNTLVNPDTLGNIRLNPNLDANFVPNTGSPAIDAGTDGENIGHTGNTAPDVTPPTIIASNPAQNATGVSTTANYLITANENLSNVNTTTVTMAGVTIGVSVSGATITITHATALQANTAYSIVLNGVTDIAGNALPNYTLNFTTGAIAPPSIDNNRKVIRFLGNFIVK